MPKAERGNTTREDRETETQGQEEEARVVLKVPYVKGASEKLKKSLKKAAGVDVVFSGGVSIKQKLCAKLKPVKDPMEKQGTVVHYRAKTAPVHTLVRPNNLLE